LRNIKRAPMLKASSLIKLAITAVSESRFNDALRLYTSSIELCEPYEENIKLLACSSVCEIYTVFGDTGSFFAFVKVHRLLPEHISLERLTLHKEAYGRIFKAAGTIYKIGNDLMKAKSYLIKHLSLITDSFDAALDLINVYIDGNEWDAALKKTQETETRLLALESQGIRAKGDTSIIAYKAKICEKYGLICQASENFSEAGKYYFKGLKLISEEERNINEIKLVNIRQKKLIDFSMLQCALTFPLAVMKLQFILENNPDSDIKVKFANDLNFIHALINKVKKGLAETKKIISNQSHLYPKFLNNELRAEVVGVFIMTYVSPELALVDTKLIELVQKIRQSSVCSDMSIIALMMKALHARQKYSAIIALKDLVDLPNNCNMLVVSQALGTAYYQVGNYRQALVYLENLCVMDEDAGLANFIASIYCMLGEFSESRRYYRIALKNSPDKHHLYELQIKIVDLLGFFVFKEESSELKQGKLKNFLKIAKQLFEEFPELYSDNYVRDPSSPYDEAILLLKLVKDICQKSELWDKIKSLRTEAKIEAITPAEEEMCVDAFKIEREALIQKIKEYCYKDKEGSPVFPDPLRRSSKPAKEETKSAFPQPGDEGVFLFKAMPADSGRRTYSWFDVNRLRKVISDDNIERAKRLVINCERLLEDDGKDKPGVKRDNHNLFIRLPEEVRIHGRFIMLGTYNIITYQEGFNSHVAYEKARQAAASHSHQK